MLNKNHSKHEMAREELKFAETIPQEMICLICLQVLHEPHLVNCCEQQFCMNCLEKWLESNQCCPHCRSTDFSYMLMKQQRRKIRELKVYCPNRQHGCKAVLKYGECASHLSGTNSDGCLYIKLECPNHCNTKVFRWKLAEHQERVCIHRTVTCSHCKLRGELMKMVQKHVNKCPSRPTRSLKAIMN